MSSPVIRAEFEALAARVAALENPPAMPKCPDCGKKMVRSADVDTHGTWECTQPNTCTNDAFVECECGEAYCAVHLPKPEVGVRSVGLDFGSKPAYVVDMAEALGAHPPVAPPPLGTFTPDPLATNDGCTEGNTVMIGDAQPSAQAIASPTTNGHAGEVTTELDSVVIYGKAGVAEDIRQPPVWMRADEAISAAIRDQRTARKPLQARIAALDVELAEARRQAGLDGCPAGTLLCYMHAGKVRIMGKPVDEEHNCDEMGCGSAQDHVLKIIDVAKSDANAKAANDLARLRELWANGEVLTDEGIDLMRGEALLTKAGA